MDSFPGNGYPVDVDFRSIPNSCSRGSPGCIFFVMILMFFFLEDVVFQLFVHELQEVRA